MSAQAEIAGRYVLHGTLGTGAGTIVYDAFDRLIERRVAVKVVNLPPVEDAETADAIARFRRGARAAGGLNHPNIVAVFDYGENAEQAWIIMELVEGGSLKGLLDTGERLPLPRVVQLMTQLLDGLGYSHARGVVHRDVKPANLMLTPSGTLKIADFGIARLENSSMTHVGTMMGTPAYMAPEQLRGEPVDQRADLWAAGVVLYQLLSGEKPFAGGITSIMQKVLNTDPVPPSRFGVPPTGTPEIDAVVSRAMAKAPEDRFASAAEFSAALQRAAAPAAQAASPFHRPPPEPADDGTVIRPPPPRMMPPERPRPRRLLLPALGGGVVVLALLVGGSLMLGGDRPPGTAPPAAAAPPPPPVQPTQIATPTPPPMPAPPSPAPLPAPDAHAIAASLRQLPCNLVQVTSAGRTATVAGLASTASADAMRRSLALPGLPSGAVTLALDSFEAPYCGTLDLLRPVAALGDAPPNLVFTSSNPLREGQGLRFSVSTPTWPARLHVAYVTESGDVGHLVQGGPPQPPNAAAPFGDGTRWSATAPFGTDMLVVIASEAPLFPQRRRGERLEEFEIALAGALRDAQESGRVAARVVLLRTVAR
ncbi:serine/threonine-protein kinase [Belnapia rosea]|uniref:serine/threonine-protein kinase n=1 Tax=Belnapia rosea TaxID=938405 RepID=UPI00088B7D3A|nr:serine/threonine-protein kinase [Belnapia rosea]SDB72024.1 serine/threonine protein kinase [Belnapia rosea]